MRGSEGSTLVIDLIAAIRALVKHADTYMDLVWKLVGTFPKGYQRVDIVADTVRIETFQ